MGLLSSLFKPKKTTAAKPTSAAALQHQLAPWNLPTPTTQVFLTGERERHVYVYDPAPLKGIRKGGTVELEAFRGDALMVAATGTVFDTRSDGDTCLLCNGRPIGFVSIPPEEVRKAAQNGIALKMVGKSYGMLEGYKGIPEIHVPLPPQIHVEDILDEQQAMSAGVPANSRSIEYNEYDEEDFRNIASRDKWAFANARLAIIPTPKGSSAKPHVGVYSADGTLISEVAAKNGYYKELAHVAESFNNFYVTAKRWKREDDGIVAYHIIIRYW